jgi:PAS domain S-box-containing protein
VAEVAEDGTALHVLESVGYYPNGDQRWPRIPLDLPVPMTAAVRTGEAVIHRSAAARLADWPALAPGSEPGDRIEASAVMPMLFEGRSVGAIGVSWRDVRDLAPDDAWFLAAVASFGSQALERARLFAAVAERDERLQFALAASGTGAWEWDLDSARMEWSSQLFDLHGLPVGVPPDFDTWLAMIHPGDRGRLRDTIDACLRHGGSYDAEFRIRRPDGGLRWLHSIGRLVLDVHGHPLRLAGTTRDVTDRKAVEAQREELLAAEREVARLRDAFIGVVSHELRTPITTIFGGTRVLVRRWREMTPEDRDGLLADVAGEADRLYRLVEDLLVITRVERGLLDTGDEPLSLGRILARVIASEQERWPEVTFRLQVAAGLPPATGDAAYLEQVMRNLLANAAKYGGQGTSVLVTAQATGDAVELDVLDEGPGIDAAEADALFDLFYRSPRTAARTAGAGIGLFVCRQLVEVMGGTIRAAPRPTGGAAFTVTLARHEDDGPA